MHSPSHRVASLFHQAQASRLQYDNPFDALHPIVLNIRTAITSLKTQSYDLLPDIDAVRLFVLDQATKFLLSFESLHAMNEKQWKQLEDLAAFVDRCGKLCHFLLTTRLEQLLYYGKLKSVAVELLESIPKLFNGTHESFRQDWSRDDATWNGYINSGALINDVDNSIGRGNASVILRAATRSYPTQGTNWVEEALKQVCTVKIDIPPLFVLLSDIDMDPVPMQTSQLCATYRGHYNKKSVHVHRLMDWTAEGQKMFVADLELRESLASQHSNLQYPTAYSKIGPWWCIVSDRPDYGSWHTFCSVIKPSFTVKRELLLQAAQGLQYLHANHVVHHHVSLDNIVVCSTPDGKYQVKWRWGIMATKCCEPSENAVGDVKSLAHCILQVHDCDASPPSKPDAMSPSEWSLVESMLQGVLTIDEVVDTMEIDVAASRPKMTHSSSIHHLLAASKSFKASVQRSPENPTEVGILDPKCDECAQKLPTTQRQHSLCSKMSKKKRALLLLLLLLFLASTAICVICIIYFRTFSSSRQLSRIYSITRVAGSGVLASRDDNLHDASFLHLSKISGNNNGSSLNLYVLDTNTLRKISLIDKEVTTFNQRSAEFESQTNASAYPFTFNISLENLVVNEASFQTDTIYVASQSLLINITLPQLTQRFVQDALIITLFDNELYGANYTHVFNGINSTRTQETSTCSVDFCPSSVSAFVIAPNGTIFIADKQRSQIIKRDPSYHEAQFMVTNLVFSNPTGIASDSEGNIFVADKGNKRICMIDQHGNATIIADETTEMADGTQFRLNAPDSIFSTTDGILFVTDSSNGVIYKLEYRLD